MRHAALVAPVLSEFRSALDELFAHFCRSHPTLSREGFLAFAAAFDLSPGYLSADCLEEVFEKALTPGHEPSSAHTVGRSRIGMAPTDFDESMCLLALAISEKQWKVEYAAEKRARYQYQYKDAEKSRAEQNVDVQVEHLIFALELDRPVTYRQRAGIKSAIDSPATSRSKSKSALMPLSPSDLDARLRSMDFSSCAAGSIGASLAMGCTMASNGVSEPACDVAEQQLRELTKSAESACGRLSRAGVPPRVGERRQQVPPCCGSGRNSRQTGGMASIYGGGGSATGAARSPRAPARAGATAGSSSGAGPMVPAPPPTSGRPSGRPNVSGSGRSPRRLRVADSANIAINLTQGSKMPTPPSSPRVGSGGGSGGGRSGGGTPAPTPPSRNKENYNYGREPRLMHHTPPCPSNRILAAVHPDGPPHLSLSRTHCAIPPVVQSYPSGAHMADSTYLGRRHFQFGLTTFCKGRCQGRHAAG